MGKDEMILYSDLRKACFLLTGTRNTFTSYTAHKTISSNMCEAREGGIVGIQLCPDLGYSICVKPLFSDCVLS